MPLDSLPDGFEIATRDQIRDRYLTDYRFRVPSADTSPSSQVFVEGSNIADQTAPLYNDARLAADAAQIESANGAALDAWGRRLGVPRRGVTKSTGFVIVSTASGGSNIIVGTELKHPLTGQKFLTTVTAVYLDQQAVPIQSVDGGPTTNLVGGTKLIFTTPPVGASQQAIVLANSDGSGLTGGAPAEGDDDYRSILLSNTSEPPAAGNEAQAVAVVESIADLAVLKAFAYPAVFGPGTTAVAFIVPPATLGGSVLPNSVQIAEVEARLKDALPGDEGIVVASGAEQAVRVRVLVTWKDSAHSWLDSTPWPPNVVDPVHVTIGFVGSATVNSASSFPAPVAGQTVGFYDTVSRTFKRKKILSVTGGGPYTLTFDLSTLGSSDLSYVPVVNQVVVPWADTLNDLIPPILTYFQGQGPGEMFSTFFDPGRRQKRFPAPAPDAFSSRIENRMVDGLFSVVEDAVIYEPTVPFATTVGTPGVLFYIHALSDLGVYPE